MRNYRKAVLSIAGSDSSGGAGIQADVKTCSALGVYGMSVITAITAQNTKGVSLVEDVSPQLVAEQVKMVMDDIFPESIKIGMVSSAAIIESVAAVLEKYPIRNLVVDPVMVSKSGYHLLSLDAECALTEVLLPLADLVTPNIPEAEVLSGMKIHSLGDMEKAARKILMSGPSMVLVKGGHLSGAAKDILVSKDSVRVFQSERIGKPNTHGTGCTLSSAIAAHLALGFQMEEAVELSKRYVTEAIGHSFQIGGGIGPVHHFYQWEEHFK
ncbi:bifunctional hydroxymethylpyrimidine kinase/phosphomethylpyrimidine kinase [Bacillus sp. 1P06AnD]|uniref:bifunctional hydroxymethylpyrimidine kinase/phosphomethylpyrimidine kinase n=1 Tax=Bacillus sp. 1P06AnD TaxID=3132208 RepID=UPI0039A1E553